MECLTTCFGKIVPRSPYDLLQEVYITDPWKMMVCCIMLNQTSRNQVDSIRDEFFGRWPTAEALSAASTEEVAEAIRSLGFCNRRSKALVRFSTEWSEKDWEEPMELHGIGQYAQDSWDIFVKGEVPDAVADHVLSAYVGWRKDLKRKTFKSAQHEDKTA